MSLTAEKHRRELQKRTARGEKVKNMKAADLVRLNRGKIRAPKASAPLICLDCHQAKRRIGGVVHVTVNGVQTDQVKGYVCWTCALKRERKARRG